MRQIQTLRKISFIMCFTLVIFGCDTCKGKVKTDSDEASEDTINVLPQINNFQENTEDTIVYPYAPEIMMVYVEGGSFQMGKNLGTVKGRGDENHVHRVTVNSFYISKYEVTQGQYKAVMGSLPDNYRGGDEQYGIGDDYPVYYVNWYNAIEFCNKLSELEGLSPYYIINKDRTDPNNTCEDDTIKWLVISNPAANGYCLPTEAQWEYAAKGGNKGEEFSFSGSDDPDEVAWYSENSYDSTHEVGTKKPNGLDLYDMSGNLEEWCWDWSDDYTSTAETDPLGPVSGNARIIRGGNFSVNSDFIHSTERGGCDPYWRTTVLIGFRIARPVHY